MMKFSIKHNLPEVQQKIQRLGKAVPSVLREAINRTADWAATDVGREMRKVFDRPTPYTLKSLRVFYASTSKLEATLWFKQRSRDADKPWAMPQIAGGARDMKPMEQRLQQAGILPAGWFVVPGGAAPLDGYGNVSRGEISRILNVLGTFREAGYNKANDKTRQRLRKGNAKKGSYGFAYWVNPPGVKRQSHLQPGIYRRVYTTFGQSLKPILIFVNKAKYRSRLDFFGIARRTFERRFPDEVDKAMQSLMKTGSASGVRRGVI